ncbi:MAG: biotin/lipoate A/B protein ligase family protein [Isosphaeraceae bacterium]|nr:biotin/lipoate A/B protein ligase family protein [Isosphaeraceae bacterium]
MSVPCRLLPHTSAPGDLQMATDEALLDSVAADGESAVLRTYDWSPPALTLGYFQSIHDPELSQPRWGVPIFRRATGGGAIWHDREITYTIVIPRIHPLARRSTDLYRAIHGALAMELRRDGLEATRRAEFHLVDPLSRPHPVARPLLCFEDGDPEDILLHGHKIIGSAQRRRLGAVLQHGSILLSAAQRTPELPGIREITGVEQDLSIWSARIARAIPFALDLEPIRSEPTPSELADADRLRREVYGTTEWTGRR